MEEGGEGGEGEKIKILWMHDEFDGLENGLAFL